MLLSYNWLKRFLPLKVPAETAAKRLVAAGVEVSSLRSLGAGLEKVVVADLLSVEKHPQADRLSLTKVSDGKTTYQVVCGAKNIAPGQRVPLALVGAVLPNGMAIQKAMLRGVESHGMLCSAKELALAEDAQGILQLPKDAPVGTGLASYLGLPDTLLELEITPNRADLLGHLGVARELGALLGLKLKPSPSPRIKEGKAPVAKKASLDLEAKDLCFLYTGRVIEGVRVGPSPAWLAQALERLGQRSINNVVDATNYVLQEMGQPLHAFDLDRLEGSRVVVRKARPGERIPLLDGSEKALKEDMLVIADAAKPVALAGIMGGSNSQVLEGTTRVLLESALFLPGSVRRTARALGLSTDSSYRFERGVDPEGVRKALERCASLILEVAGGTPAKGILTAASRTPKPAVLHFRPERTNALLGTDLDAPAQMKVLKALGCRTSGPASKKGVKLTAPSWRLDLTREIDLIEEVARVLGYDRIPVTSPRIPSQPSELGTEPAAVEELRSHLHHAGFYEARSSTFLPVDFSRRLGLTPDHPLRAHPEVINPIAEDQKALRPSLLPSLLAAVELNLSHRQAGVRLYEWDKVFLRDPQGGVLERLQAAAVAAGEWTAAQWHQKERPADFFDLKGLAEALLSPFEADRLRWETGSGRSPYSPFESFRVLSPEGKAVLWGGSLEPRALKEFGLGVPCVALEADLTSLLALPPAARSFKPISKFPPALRDVALVVPDGVTSEQVLRAIQEAGGASLREIRLFDLYRGPALPPGSRSLAYRLRFMDDTRTLTDAEVTQQVDRIVETLGSRYSIALR